MIWNDEFETLPREALEALQAKRLQRVVERVYAAVPFYRQHFDNTDLALVTLKESGFTDNKTEVVAVEVPDQPGGLYKILQVLDDARINVKYMYAFAELNADNAVIICRFDETDAAINTLREKDVNILAGDQLYNL